MVLFVGHPSDQVCFASFPKRPFCCARAGRVSAAAKTCYRQRLTTIRLLRSKGLEAKALQCLPGCPPGPDSLSVWAPRTSRAQGSLTSPLLARFFSRHLHFNPSLIKSVRHRGKSSTDASQDNSPVRSPELVDLAACSPVTMLPRAFVTLLTDLSYLPGALVLLHALRQLHPAPRDFKIVCLITPETVDARAIGILQNAGFDLVVGVEPIASGKRNYRGLELMGTSLRWHALTGQVVRI